MVKETRKAQEVWKMSLLATLVLEKPLRKLAENNKIKIAELQQG